MEKLRTRFAPSPTGYMHIGNLRTALYCFLIAKHSGGDFILRIEDTDQNRLVKGATDIIYNTLKLTKLKYDEGPDIGGKYGPYIQSKRLNIYKKYAKKLVELGGAHYCFCKNKHDETKSFHDPCINLSKEEIEEKIKNKEPYAIRQTIKKYGKVTFKDEIYGKITTEKRLLNEGILLKSDGFPTYNFANVVDDHLMKINCVVRGNEYLSSTPKYNLIYEAFGWEIPMYIHLPAVMKDEEHKLSKRNGDASFNDLVDKGYLPEAILNYIALLGWSANSDKEIFSLDELIKEFTIDRISKSPAIFDIEKLKWMNGIYIRNLSNDDFDNLANKYYSKYIKENIDTKYLSEVLHNRVDVLDSIPDMISFLENLTDYNTDLYINKRMKSTKEKSLYCLEESYKILENIDFKNLDNLQKEILDIPVKLEKKNGEVLWPLRVALSGKEKTPGGAVEIAYLLKKDESLKRIKIGINKLKENKNVL